MVSSKIVSQYFGELPKSEKDRKIKGQTTPLYGSSDVLGLLEQGSSLRGLMVAQEICKSGA